MKIETQHGALINFYPPYVDSLARLTDHVAAFMKKPPALQQGIRPT